jgi:hypothetical protein
MEGLRLKNIWFELEDHNTLSKCLSFLSNQSQQVKLFTDVTYSDSSQGYTNSRNIRY